MLKAAWPRPCNNAALASLKNLPSDFFNHASGMTEPKDAFYAGTGVTAYRHKSDIYKSLLNKIPTILI